MTFKYVAVGYSGQPRQKAQDILDGRWVPSTGPDQWLGNGLYF